MEVYYLKKKSLALLTLIIALCMIACSTQKNATDQHGSLADTTTAIVNKPATVDPTTTVSSTTEPTTTVSATTKPTTTVPATTEPTTTVPSNTTDSSLPTTPTNSKYVCPCGFSCACVSGGGMCSHFLEHFADHPECCSHPESWRFYNGTADYHYQVCSLCLKEFERSPHGWALVPELCVKGDCNTAEVVTKECTTCNTVQTKYSGVVHDYGEAVYTEGCKNRFPTYTRTCQICGDTEYGIDENRERIPCFGGTATCTSGPICVNCGYEYGSSLGGHRGGVATCSSGAICDNCGCEYSKALGHRNTYVTGQAEPTCSNGYTGDTHCSDCGTVIRGSIIPAVYEHNWIEISRTQTATEWTVVSQCSQCNSTYTNTIKFG